MTHQYPPRARWAQIVGAVVLALGIGTACSVPVETTDVPAAKPSASAPLPQAVDLPESEAPTPEPPEKARVAAFGEAFTYEDGVEVVLSKPVKIGLPDYYSNYEEAGIEGSEKTVALVKFTLTVTNNTGAQFDPSMASISAYVGEDAQPLDAQCFTDVVTCGTSQTVLREGRKVVVSWAYAVPRAKANLISVEATPTWEHEPAVFEGAFK